MQFCVTKSGLEILDTCRAYGLAELVRALTRGRISPTICDLGGSFLIRTATDIDARALPQSDEWRAVFAENAWQQVFLTYKKQWPQQRDKVRKSIEQCYREILARAATGLGVDFGGPRTLPGALDPSAFKGLKGLTGGNYAEGATLVDEASWALACLGGAVAQRYKLQRAAAKKWAYFVTVPVPSEVRFSDFRSIRNLVYGKGLSYNGVLNAAAHFSLLLAVSVREKAQGNPMFPVRFSRVAYFSLFQSGQQYKPSMGGVVDVERLTRVALARPEAAAEMFTTWDYLFRRGSTQGGEDLAEAITELITAPSFETYYQHARIFLRYIVDRNKGVKHENLYTKRALEEVINYVQ